MTNLANINDMSNSVKSIPAIMHNGIPVVTTELLAELYDTKSNNIKVNHSRNAGRFIEGKHYFKVIGNALKNLRVTLSNLQISPKARSLILWTERGAARHAKMLDTDKAWDVFELMEDHYFNKGKNEVVVSTRPITQR
ncbi:ORF6N domain-containing protein, partial [Proteus mirabilis]